MAILLLDDDADLREALEWALEEAGEREVLSAGRLREVQAMAPKALACSCAVLDVNLGPREATGLDAARWLRGQGFAGRIVFLTGHAAAYPQLRDEEGPNTILVEKPASLARLMSTIRPDRM